MKKLTYRQSMEKRCKCGACPVGGWVGDKKSGHPVFASVSRPLEFLPLCEEHTVDTCFIPQKIA